MRLRDILGCSLLAVGLVACGGAQKPSSGLQAGTKDVPPPPDVANVKPDAPDVVRQVSTDAKNDYASAMDFYTKSATAGWNESSCRSAADQFSAVARAHKDVVEAQYMVGRSYHNCGLAKEAEDAYQAALKVKPNHGASISNLGELYFAAGKLDGARKYWESAIKATPKLTAAYVNLASLNLAEMRRTKDSAAWGRLEEDARKKLSNALAVDNDNVRAYTVYGLVYMEGRQKNRNRLDLAKLLLEEGEKKNPKYAPLQHALGLLALSKNNLTDALARFQAAAELDPKLPEAHMNVGLIQLGTRRYDIAKDAFQKVLAQQPKNYEAMIGLGVAQRGLGDLDGAEASYKKAKDLEPKRGDAYFNLGVLYKDFRANKESDLKAMQSTAKVGRQFFQDFLSKEAAQADKDEAQENIKAIDKLVKQLDEAMKMQASMQPPPAPTPAPAPAPPAGGQ
ncbi:MAG: tetratricopeptide repeat protein [Kofleriaceae bacterium]|jgi:tetratricopeptide (TPR) repeat protein|nr:tetratricopeptide repeat protein [Kofleriaceae bacterium]MBP9859972.1 tetratricopeptide repeat protein [Kofleriaceae bacterium]